MDVNICVENLSVWGGKESVLVSKDKENAAFLSRKAQMCFPFAFPRSFSAGCPWGRGIRLTLYQRLWDKCEKRDMYGSAKLPTYPFDGLFPLFYRTKILCPFTI